MRDLRRNLTLILRLSVTIFILIAAANAQRLAISSYQTSDGLAHNSVRKIFQDAKGYLWIGTAEGLSRFDGYEFKNYDTRDGLGHVFINDIVADNLGHLWIATNGGVSMLVDDPPLGAFEKYRKKFLSYKIDVESESKANKVFRILFDPENRLWCSTENGIFLAKTLDSKLQIEVIVPATGSRGAMGSLRDVAGRLWFANGDGDQIVQISEGKIRKFNLNLENNDRRPVIKSIIQEPDGRILAADYLHIFEFTEGGGGGGMWRVFSTRDGKKMSDRLPSSDGYGGGIRTMLPSEDELLVGTAFGLLQWDVKHDSTSYSFSADEILTLLHDADGNLWVGTGARGLRKVPSGLALSFGSPDQLLKPIVRAIPSRDGQMYFLEDAGQLGRISQENEVKKIAGSPHFSSQSDEQWVMHQDRNGRWWFGSQRGLELSRTSEPNFKSGSVVRTKNGYSFNASLLYEDERGEFWAIGSTAKNFAPNDFFWEKSPRDGLFKIENGVAKLIAGNVSADFMVRARSSETLWLADSSMIWRFKDGRLETVEAMGLPGPVTPRCLFSDSKGRVWIGTGFDGAFVTSDPESATPRFSRYTASDGLLSDSVFSIAEDNLGNLYFGTGHGIARLNKDTSEFHHYSQEDGVLAAQTGHLIKDSQGFIWGSSTFGLTKIDPRSVRKNETPPPVYITGLRINGKEVPLAETGVVEVPALELEASENDISIQFVGVSFFSKNELHYEYQFNEHRLWSGVPPHQRELTFPNMGPGTYRFKVRAVNSEFIPSSIPAVFEFKILRPFYLRWWFIATGAVLAGILIYLIYRTRVRRLVEIERTRTRIATDLHDDIGANLTKITIMSEVVRQQLGEGQNGKRDLLKDIAEVSRESVSAMGDIVWAINPKKDTVIDLVQRMRRHAEESLGTKGIDYEVRSPVSEVDERLGMNVRRNIFLIYKEALNNIIKHSDATEVIISLHATRSGYSIEVSDNGDGFELNDAEGNGLINMNRRAEELGGKLTVESQPGTGTRIELIVQRN